MPRLKVLNRITGKLEQHELEQADRLVAEGQDYDYPEPAELERLERVEQYGTTGQQATAATESVFRTATFGAWQGFDSQADIDARRKTLQEESPGIAFGAQAVGAALPAIAGGALAEGAVAAAGLGARAAAGAGVAAEGIAGGLADEVEQAAIDDRPVSAGRAMLVGIGGEIVGRAIPAALKAGVGRLSSPTATDAVAGATVTDVSQAVGKKARDKVAAQAYDMPPGPARDAALVSTAPDQLQRSEAEIVDATAKASELLAKLADDAPRALERNITGTVPSQLQWSADVAGELRAMARGAGEAEAKVLNESADALLEAKTGKDIWRAASEARKRVAEQPKALGEPRSAERGSADVGAGGTSAPVDYARALKDAGFGGVGDFEPEELSKALSPLLPGVTAEDMRSLVGGGIVEPSGRPGISVLKDGVMIMAPLKDGGTIKRMLYIDPQTGEKIAAHLEFYLEGQRGQGLGKKVLDKSIETYRKAGFDKIILDAEGGSEKVWGRYGFERVGGGSRMEMQLSAPTPAKGGFRRNPAGARLLETAAAPGSAPDFSTWDPSDFGRGRGGSKAAGKHSEDYSGGATLSTYQRSIVDGLKKNAGFASTGRVTGDAGKLGSEPTFHVQPDGSVRLTHGRLRLTAARELGRAEVYGKVVKGNAKAPEVVFEGQIRVGAGGPQQAPEVTGGPPVSSPMSRAGQLIAERQADVGTWGRAAEGVRDLNGSASPGPGAGDPVSALEDQLAAAHRWRAGSDDTRAKLAEQAARMRAAQDLRSETERAVASSRATKPGPPGLGGAVAREAGEYMLERAIGAAVPGAGFAVKTLWGALGAQGQSQIKRAARTLLSPLTSQARYFAAPRAVVAMTALERFKGDSPDVRAAYESRRELLTQVAGTPQLAGQAMASAMAGLAAESPSNYVSLTRRMTESLQYVALNLPPTVAVSLSYPLGIPPTDPELRDVADLWNTAFEPETAIDSIASRDATPVQMRTLRELHPDIYSELQREIIMQSPDTFASLDSQTKLSIDIMFGSDGVGGLFATSEAARYVADAHKRSAKQPDDTPVLQPRDQSATVEAAGVRAVRTGVTNRGTL